MLTLFVFQLTGQSEQKRSEFDSISYTSAIKKLDYLEVVLDSLRKNYSYFSKPVLSLLDSQDLASIELLSQEYLQRANRLENEMMFNFYSKDITSTELLIYSKVSFEIMKMLPDTYAFLFNDTNFSYRPDIENLNQRDLLYSKYRFQLDSIFEKWKSLRIHFRRFLIENKLRDSFQSEGIKNDMDTEKSDFLDLLVWVVNHKELPHK